MLLGVINNTKIFYLKLCLHKIYKIPLSIKHDALEDLGQAALARTLQKKSFFQAVVKVACVDIV